VSKKPAAQAEARRAPEVQAASMQKSPSHHEKWTNF